jgi:hypothetical protein
VYKVALSKNLLKTCDIRNKQLHWAYVLPDIVLSCSIFTATNLKPISKSFIPYNCTIQSFSWVTHIQFHCSKLRNSKYVLISGNYENIVARRNLNGAERITGHIDNILGDLEGGVTCRCTSNLFEMKESKTDLENTRGGGIGASLAAQYLTTQRVITLLLIGPLRSRRQCRDERSLTVT